MANQLSMNSFNNGRIKDPTFFSNLHTNSIPLDLGIGNGMFVLVITNEK